MKFKNMTTLNPSLQFIETAGLLRGLKERGEAATRWEECLRLENVLKADFQQAFGLSSDRRQKGWTFYMRLKNLGFVSELPAFDHLNFFHRGDNLVIVSQPYHLAESILAAWCREVGATYQVANEWGFYYPQSAKLFMVEFAPEAVAKLGKSAEESSCPGTEAIQVP